MRKSLLLTAVLASIALPTVVMAEDAVAPATVAVSPHTFTYNIGLYSQYIFRGLTQTANKPAIQGGMDYSHSSGLYAGTWASNISWLQDGGLFKHSSLEWDIYGGYRNTFGDTGIGYDVGLLNYIYPATRTTAGKIPAVSDPYTLEAYGALSYKWLQAKVSYGITDIFAVDDSSGSYYAELNANVPVYDSGYTINLHYGYQDYKGHAAGVADSNDKLYTYNDWKLGVTKSWSNGVNVGAYYTDTDANKNGYGKALYSGTDLADSAFTVFVQKTF